MSFTTWGNVDFLGGFGGPLVAVVADTSGAGFVRGIQPVLAGYTVKMIHL